MSADEATGALSLRAALLRGLAGDGELTVVSNNCWGAHVYQKMGLAYRTPFVGLFITPEPYLRLLRDFDRLIVSDLVFLEESADPRLNARRRREGASYPIGLLGGEVEIHFQHYADRKEARDKWHRRVARMVADPARRFFKFDDREGASEAQIAAFCALPLANKLCFTARRHPVDTVVVPPGDGSEEVIDGLALANISRHHANVLRWISTRPRWLPLPSLL